MRSAFLKIACPLALMACAPREQMSDTAGADTAGMTAAAAANTATAVMRDASGRDLGTLTLSETTGGISLSGRIGGVAPGEHGLHLHGVGRCDPPTFESAGDHWNPTGRGHGRDNPQGPHFGDLPNATSGSDSAVVVQGVETPGGKLRGDSLALLDGDGAAVVLHAKPDDYRSDPAGAAGDRIACGVVTAS